MAINPIDSTTNGTVSDASSEAAFNAAVDASQGELSEADLTERMVEGAIVVAGQMIIMPRANEILSEGMSDD